MHVTSVSLIIPKRPTSFEQIFDVTRKKGMRERNVHFDLGVSDYQIDRLAGRRKAVKKSELEVSTITNHQVFLSPKARRKAQNEIVRLNCAGFTVVLKMGSYF